MRVTLPLFIGYGRSLKATDTGYEVLVYVPKGESGRRNLARVRELLLQELRLDENRDYQYFLINAFGNLGLLSLSIWFAMGLLNRFLFGNFRLLPWQNPAKHD